MISLPSKYMEYFAGTGPKEGPLAVDPAFRVIAPDHGKRCIIGNER